MKNEDAAAPSATKTMVDQHHGGKNQLSDADNKLVSKLCHQLEFYLGDSNLIKDRFMRQKLAS